MENEIVFIKLDDIIPNRFQPREVFEEEALNKLADSIRRHGVIEPILVRPVSNKFEIIAGERRYKASVLAGLTKIPAIIKPMDDKESSIVAYVENEHRSGVSAIEEARTIDRILKSNNMNQDELAKELGINQSTLANKLRLLSLPNEIQDALMHNEISERHARSLLSIKDVSKQIELLNKIKENKMTVRELESEIKSMNNDNNMNEYLNTNNDFDLNSSVDNIYSGMNNIDTSNNNDFLNYLNNYDNNNSLASSVSQVDNNLYLNTDNNTENNIYNEYLNNNDNNNNNEYYQPTDNNTVINDQNDDEDPSFMSFLNNYDNNNPLPEENTDTLNNNLDNNIDNNYEQNINDFVMPEENTDNVFLNSNYEEPKENNVVINDVNPPITSNFSNNTYIEDNPNFVDVSQNVVVDNVDEIINKLKVVVDDIKETSKFKIDTDEINYDDIYQITIRIDKRDF